MVQKDNKLARCGLGTSVLEKFHCQMFSNILSKPGCDVLGEQDFQKRSQMKQMVYSLILYTDMAFHNKLFGDFRKIQLGEKGNEKVSFSDLKVT